MGSDSEEAILFVRKKVLQGRARFSTGQGAEKNVEDNMVSPILRSLGWGQGVNMILHEEDVKLRRGKGRADLVLSSGQDQYILALEAKKLGEEVSGSSTRSVGHIDQLIDYLISLNLEFGILTDGEWWHLIRRSGYDWDTIWLKNFLKDDIDVLTRVLDYISPANSLELSNRVEMERKKLGIFAEEWSNIQEDHELQLRTLGNLLLNQVKRKHTEMSVEPIEVIEFLREQYGGLLSKDTYGAKRETASATERKGFETQRAKQELRTDFPVDRNRHIRTREAVFIQPILKALVILGGSGSVKDIMKLVYKEVQDQLTSLDHEIVTPNEPRWRNNARWSAKTMAEEGLIEQGPPRGVWHITHKGKNAIL